MQSPHAVVDISFYILSPYLTMACVGRPPGYYHLCFSLLHVRPRSWHICLQSCSTWCVEEL